MLITKYFVVINNPKTGSGFVRNVIRQLYKKEKLIVRLFQRLKLVEPKVIELKLPDIKMPGRLPNQHGTYTQIKKKYLNREIVSVIRNPYSRFLSLYEFKSWVIDPPTDSLTIKKKFPSFPDLNIDQFVDLQLEAEKTRLDNKVNLMELGNQTIQFFQMFFRNPKLALSKVNDQYIESGEYKKDMANITFLKQENLNQELYNFLSRFNYPLEDLDFIKTYKKINVTKSKISNRNSLWSEKSILYVKKRERFLLKILLDMGFDYHEPIIWRK